MDLQYCCSQLCHAQEVSEVIYGKKQKKTAAAMVKETLDETNVKPIEVKVSYNSCLLRLL